MHPIILVPRVVALDRFHCMLKFKVQQPSHYPDALMSVRHSLVTSKMIGASSPIQRPSLNEHCSTLYASIKSGLEASLTKVKEFIASTVSFSMRNAFRREFCMTNVRSGIVMTFINFVLETCEVQQIVMLVCLSPPPPPPPPLHYI